MWYIMLMRNSNSTMSINHLSLDFICLLFESKWFITLWGSNMPCAYSKPRKCEHVRYCHLELILKIILFLCGMFAHTSSFLFNNFLLIISWILFCESFYWKGCPQMCSLVSFWKTICIMSFYHCFAWLHDYLEQSISSL